MVAAALARGDQRFDPVRFRVIEAMARRAAALDGEVRRIVDDKVIALLAAYGEDLEKAKSAEAAEQPAEPERDAFAELIEHIAKHAPAAVDVPATTATTAATAAKTTATGKAAPRPSSRAAAPAPAAELKSIRYFKSTWSKLSADRRLNQSRAKVPQNAGPLNSHQLVHRSLTLMRDMSPEYLNRFMAYVDALSWVEQLNGAAAAANAASPRAEGAKKSGRGSKSG